MHLNLQHCRFDSSVVQYLSNGHSCNITEADIAAESIGDKALHRLPCLLVSNTCVKYHAAIRCVPIDRSVEVFPFGRVLLFDRHVSQSDREMDQVQVNVVDA